MHIEPGIVTGAKLALSYATGAAAGGCALKLAVDTVREQGIASSCAHGRNDRAGVLVSSRSCRTSGSGSPRCISSSARRCSCFSARRRPRSGLALGLLLQGCSSCRADLPQFGMNVTTLLVPLFAIQALAARIIPRNTAYVDLQYRQALCDFDGVPVRNRGLGRVLGALWLGLRRGEPHRDRVLRRILRARDRRSSRWPIWRCWRWQSRCEASQQTASSRPACTTPLEDDVKGGR